MPARPPEEIAAGPVVLRRWRLDDVAELQEAVLARVDHLRPWMPWAADEPIDLGARRALVEIWEQVWAEDEPSVFAFAIVEDGRVVGGIGAHARIGTGGLEIGSWLRPDAEGRGLARAAAGALTEAALALDGVTHVEIRHDVADVRSARIPEALGFRHVEDRARPAAAPGETGIERVWRRVR